jgi:hypothetical protein
MRMHPCNNVIFPEGSERCRVQKKAWNSRHKVITQTNVDKSNKKWSAILCLFVTVQPRKEYEKKDL